MLSPPSSHEWMRTRRKAVECKRGGRCLRSVVSTSTIKSTANSTAWKTRLDYICSFAFPHAHVRLSLSLSLPPEDRDNHFITSYHCHWMMAVLKSVTPHTHTQSATSSSSSFSQNALNESENVYLPAVATRLNNNAAVKPFQCVACE